MADEFILADGDDWQGLYFNGVLVTEGHEVTKKELVEALDYRLSDNFSYDEKEVDSAWLANEGSLPRHIDNVRWL